MIIPEGYFFKDGVYWNIDGSGPYTADATWGMAPAALKQSPSEQLGGQSITLLRNPSTTVQTVLYPSGALSLALSYRQLPGGAAVAGQFARVVVNAASDADAAGKLATDNAFIPLCQGDDIAFGASAADPITRVDVCTSQAVGAETTILTLLAGVQS